MGSSALMAMRGRFGAPASSSIDDEHGTGGGESCAGGGEWIGKAERRLQAKEEGTGRPGKLSAATWRPRMARWLSTEQLGCTGQGRRPRCPWWAGWACWGAVD